MTFGCLGPKDFKPVGKPIPSPDGELQLVPMANEDYTDAKRGRLLTFDVRDANDDFRHHVQTDAQWTAEWVLGWHDDNTVVVRSSDIGICVYQVGLDSMVREFAGQVPDDIKTTAERLAR